MGEKKTLDYALKLKFDIIKKLNRYGKKANSLKETINFILERNF